MTRTSPAVERLRRELAVRLQSVPGGARVPAERELAEEFGVSRATLRKVLAEFERDGVLARRQGSGTFVAPSAGRPRVSHQLQLTSFSEEMQRIGMTSTSRVLASSREPAGPRYAKRLQVSPADRIIKIQRLRLGDGEPMALEWLALPEKRVPGLDVDELDHGSLYGMLLERYDLPVTGGTQSMEATVTDADESRILNVSLFSPAMVVERTTWTADRVVIEHARSIYRGDRYVFTADLVPPEVPG